MIANGARETSYVWIVVNITGHNNKKVKGILYIALLQTEYAHDLFFKYIKFTSRIYFLLFLCTAL